MMDTGDSAMGNGYIQIPGYEILRPLGAGGMSTVYLALQRSLDRTVAIKVMRRGVDAAAADTAQSEKRFLLEGRMMAKLPHRNIVAVYDIVSIQPNRFHRTRQDASLGKRRVCTHHHHQPGGGTTFAWRIGRA